MTTINIQLNGAHYSAPAENNMLLVDFLRSNGLTGTHVGCETSQCGACNVLVDNKLLKSCTTFAFEAQGVDVLTIEGMVGAHNDLHPIQEAFRELHALQCGFCTPGMIMTTLALLRENPKPTEGEIRHYLAGSLCRCTGYQNIVAAIQFAAEKMEAAHEQV
ncbi:(2Fe-2S)-binding protein [Agrobacterium tumefaciens]|uniref:Carbon-monoxide dehydrogenase small subunit n=1 Tax=Agrobacterium tumefaciens TaxID=358 RepID=A0A2L2LM55_AGRTU|nr:(2Fe-2S)-binding protein [Agrobacterium tumefaciens]AVH45409.1 carbon-monoxide dehydrogenase small subunit [Agrobacterium tumefaciens]NSY99138.1 (2Fe-2S)-binding protein [Agrobacterium tumefaciens]